MSQGMQTSLEDGKSKKTDSLSEPLQEKISPADLLLFKIIILFYYYKIIIIIR